MSASSRARRPGRLACAGLLAILTLPCAFPTAPTAPAEAVRVATPRSPDAPDLGRPLDWPLPSRVPLASYEARLFAFLNARGYVALGWRRDKGVRDTGPFVGGKSFGTHPAVRVFYSPGVVRWLLNGRSGPIPDGEMIVKEQYAAPADRHQGKSEAELWGSLESWTVMVKDSSGARDGWFWSNPAKGQCVVDNHRDPFPHPISGFGHYCLRCHAATMSPGAAPGAASNEYTFASLRNIEGFPGEPIRYDVDDSWRVDSRPATTPRREADPHSPCVRPEAATRPDRPANAAFLSYFRAAAPVGLADVQHLPPATHDWVPFGRDPGREFVTSNQCMGCHAGLMAPFGPSMFLPAGGSAEYGAPGRDVSPHGEWRWTPMGLAGRDPVFLAQVEAEVRSIREDFRSDPAFAEALSSTLADTCLRCHGVMGHRQFDADHAGTSARFSPGRLLEVAAPGDHPGAGDAKYGALARDGVGCVVCHRMQPPARSPGDARPELRHFLESSITGRFRLGPPGEVYGPFPDAEIAPYAMEHATGLKPKGSDFLRSSRLCASCHMVSLPNVDMPLGTPGPAHRADELERIETVPLFRRFHHHVEQATYLEWLNSEYETEFRPDNPRGRSCQDCHMDEGLKDGRLGLDVPRLRTRIAAIQDATYPDAENLAPRAALDIRVKERGYRRHNFSGLNIFLIELFRQFDDVLGVPKRDVMTGSAEGAADAVAEMARRAREDVATLDLRAEWAGPGRLEARVVVRNEAGHRFPTGVGFRRAFLELAVLRGEEVVWASGRTDGLGVLIGADGRPLPSESFAPDPATGRQRYQGHHEVITSSDQVQVYETLLRDAKGRFTTSFVRGCVAVKDNRLLPRGWRREGPGAALGGRLLEATRPGADVADDPRYGDGSGSDAVTYRIDLPDGLHPARLRVRATLYYQALPPYFLRDLFAGARDGPASRRLHELCSRVELRGTPIEGWKLRIASEERDPGPRPLVDPDVRAGGRGSSGR